MNVLDHFHHLRHYDDFFNNFLHQMGNLDNFLDGTVDGYYSLLNFFDYFQRGFYVVLDICLLNKYLLFDSLVSVDYHFSDFGVFLLNSYYLLL